jgi:hypothetical protein
MFLAFSRALYPSCQYAPAPSPVHSLIFEVEVIPRRFFRCFVHPRTHRLLHHGWMLSCLLVVRVLTAQYLSSCHVVGSIPANHFDHSPSCFLPLQTGHEGLPLESKRSVSDMKTLQQAQERIKVRPEREEKESRKSCVELCCVGMRWRACVQIRPSSPESLYQSSANGPQDCKHP